MATKNLECQIATGQIGRYLAGEALSAESIRQLEAHVGECSDCKRTLTERRNQLMAMLGQNPTKAAVQAAFEPVPERAPRPARTPKAAQPEPIAAAHPFTEALRAAQAKSASSPTAAQPNAVPGRTFPPISKPLILSGALALVLVAMSYASRSGFLNAPKAMAASMLLDQVKPEKPAEQKSVKPPVATEVVQPPKKEAAPVVSAPPAAAPQIVTPKVTPQSPTKNGATTPEVKKPAVKTVTPAKAAVDKPVPAAEEVPPTLTNPRPARPRTKRKWRSRRATTRASSVRAYDPTGAPIQ